MTGKPYITIIMPVYKAEKSLRRAAASVLNQSLANIELILVDDQSPDESSRIADEIAKGDTRVRVIHKEINEGPGFARNTGLACATGEYIAFIDSDDWIEQNMLKTMYTKAEEERSDVVVCGYSQDMVDLNGHVRYSVTVSPSSAIASDRTESVRLAAQIDVEKSFAFLWNKLYRAEIIKENVLLFTSNMFNEDFLFNIAFFEHVNRISTVAPPLYHYIRPVTMTLSTAYITEFEELINQRFELIKQFAQHADVYNGGIRADLCNVHIKHLFAIFERQCWPQSGMSFRQRCAEVKRILMQPNTQEAMRYAKGTSRASNILNSVIGMHNPFLIAVFARLIRLTKAYLPRIFDTMK